MDPVNELNTILLNMKIPNALLFTGNCGQEKKKAAMTFVKNINCLGREFPADSQAADLPSDCIPCNQCRSCTKIDALMHPDIITVAPEPEKMIIKISQIRDLFGAIVSKPHEARMRMVIIEDAHVMNREAANSLLKILEEPPERTFFVLLAVDLNDLMPTIISRCRHIRFKPISELKITERLIVEFDLPPLMAKIAARSSSGDMQKAMMFANVKHNEINSCDSSQKTKPITAEKSRETESESGTDWLSIRCWLLDQLFLLVQPNKSRSSLFLYALALAEKLSRETLLMPDCLSLIKLWLRDMALIKYFSKSDTMARFDSFVNSDCIHPLSEVVSVLPENFPIAALEAMHVAEKKLQTNASVRLILEHFFLSIIPVNISPESY
ncbi:MAG: hypothetical protein HQK62_10295 [Desulfamplus sp.]|nr:hypothetical protein [Desulfamplus sp.]